MDEQKTGGPAFPVTIDDVRDFSAYGDNNLTGMTLRDWFAGQALNGLLATFGKQAETRDGYAKEAYHYADAMLAERQK